MYQPKVNNTQKHSDSIVHVGRLLLIEDKSIKGNQNHTLWRNKNGQILHTGTSNSNELIALKPVIISETEKIKVGDWYYNLDNGKIETNKRSKLWKKSQLR